MGKSAYLFGLRVASAALDLALICSISILLQAPVYLLIFIPFSFIFSAVFTTYYTCSYTWLKGRTPAKVLTGLRIVNTDGDAPSLSRIVWREIGLKGGIGLLIPNFVLPALFEMWSSASTLAVYLVLVLLTLTAFFVTRNMWWEQGARTHTFKAPWPSRQGLSKVLYAALTVFLAAVCLLAFPFVSGRHQMENAFLPTYPETDETRAYARFLKQNAVTPVEYLFDLFKKYDLVVISERFHPEYTQYDLLTAIVEDERFIREVGNIFTECGSVSFQDTVNTYLHTIFDHEDTLNQKTAELQRNSNGVWPLWDNTNLFDFLKTVNKQNATLPDSAKINWYFTDLPVDWRTMTHEKFVVGYTNSLRDSIMAAHTIEAYCKNVQQQRRKKALVIMNGYHGYGLLDSTVNERIRNELGGATSLLMKAFPGRVANVMVNSVSVKYGALFVPVQNGKWETAFAELGNPDLAFNFNGSPFGEDVFDARFFYAPRVKYKDLFTGFIFYKPLTGHISKTGFPFEFDHFEDTLLRRAACVSDGQVAGFQKAIAAHKENPGKTVYEGATKYALVKNLVEVVLFPFLLLVCALMSLVFYLKA